MKKWNSRKLFALVGSYALSGYLLTKGVGVSPDVIQEGAAQAAAVYTEGGFKGLIGLAQLYVTHRYIKAQASIDLIDGQKAVDMLEDVFKGD